MRGEKKNRVNKVENNTKKKKTKTWVRNQVL